ncbi:MAG: glycosyltransferase family 2 protein [Planctomycetes bacterium]|nr:glycosyltransferase family 2 protein [Planctomycetota bacterium]
MLTSPPLSIVIPSRQRVDLLGLCLASVTRHAPFGTEIIVVDDGSFDAAVSRTSLKFPGVRVVRLPRSRGYCIAANRGIEASRGAVIELLNDDTQVLAGWADAALRCFEDSRVGAVAPLVLKGVPGERPIIDSAGDGYDPGGFAWKHGHRQPLTDAFLQNRVVTAASGSSVFLLRAVLEQTGLFPEHFGAYFEDVDLSLRINALGYQVRYEPASRVWHRGGASHGTACRRLVERQSCNEERLFWRNLDRDRPLRVLARHLAVLSGKALRRLREGTLIPFLMGRLRAFSEIRHFDLNRKDDPTCPKLQPLGPS